MYSTPISTNDNVDEIEVLIVTNDNVNKIEILTRNWFIDKFFNFSSRSLNHVAGRHIEIAIIQESQWRVDNQQMYTI